MLKHLPHGRLLLVMFCATFAINVGSAGLTTNAISGKHFVVSGISSVAGFHMIRNASGHIVKLDGSATEMLNWLSKFYHFTYSVFQINATAIDSLPNQPGLISYLLREEIDMIISLSPTQSRLSFLDFSHPTLYVPVSFLIPVPDSSVKVEAVVKPFQPKVWVALILAIPSVILVLALLNRFADASLGFGNPSTMKKELRWGYSSFYILGLLLNQGSRLYGKSLSFYCLGGAWCIATFVIVNAYNSTLISHVTLPNKEPLIKSIFDLRSRPDVHLVTDRNMNTDAVLSAADTGFLKFLGDRLREYPKSRCNSTKHCVDLVKSGSHVYSSGVNSFLYGAIREDYKATGQCNLQLKRESYIDLQISWALPKQSQRLKYLNHGIMKMREAGLLDLWNKNFQPDTRKCLLNEKTSKIKTRIDKQLELGNLIGSFVVLAIGFFVSLMIFVSEVIIFYRYSHRATAAK
ncbi:hypothetical protein GHT06_021534 [Daphnia sinensis]|uniref:Ionotropic glutamate receptor C-terminal domain-containing protein n=1 Tax=Daphnia sinensis TaxID=1820382 RepID=A0AAD5KKI8_9CRUS|nr:hypothetical protein GHT06_021534 [Daphnia sinensis]